MPWLPTSSDVLGVQEHGNFDNKSSDRSHILRFWGKSQEEIVTGFIGWVGEAEGRWWMSRSSTTRTVLSNTWIWCFEVSSLGYRHTRATSGVKVKKKQSPNSSPRKAMMRLNSCLTQRRRVTFPNFYKAKSLDKTKDGDVIQMLVRKSKSNTRSSARIEKGLGTVLMM